jgi:hypothetical protein
VNRWQAGGEGRPLPCGKSSQHRPLVAVEEHGRVTLKCLDCRYKQVTIPPAVLASLLEAAPRASQPAKLRPGGHRPPTRAAKATPTRSKKASR